MSFNTNRPVFKPGKAVSNTKRVSSTYLEGKLSEGLAPELVRAYYPHLMGTRINNIPATVAVEDYSLETA